MIRDPADHINDVESRHLPSPTTSFETCESCLGGTVFRSEVEATAHLRSKHFIVSESSNTDIQKWIVSGSIAKAQLWKMLQMDILERAVSTLCTACRVVQNINIGLSDNEEDEYKDIRPTQSLYNSFSQALQLLIFMASTSRMISARAKKQGYGAEKTELSPDYKTPAIREAERQMCCTESDLVSALEAFENEMSHAVDDQVAAQYIPYATIGPEFLLLRILRNTTDRPVHDGLGVTELFDCMIRDLVSEFPPKWNVSI